MTDSNKLKNGADINQSGLSILLSPFYNVYIGLYVFSSAITSLVKPTGVYFCGKNDHYLKDEWANLEKPAVVCLW